MGDIGLMIMLEDASQSKIEEVARSVERSGVQVQQTLPHLGTIIGRGDASKINQVREIAGVEFVRPESSFQLPPMDETIPQ